MSKGCFWAVGAGVAAAAAFAGLVMAGSLTPPGPPGGTMRTLQEIYDKIETVDAKLLVPGGTRVPRTGRTVRQADGDDGDLQKGAAWPDPRFTDHGNGTVTDHLTGLMWVKAPHSLLGNTSTVGQWTNGLDYCNVLQHAFRADWRLPNLRELRSIVDYGRSPALPAGHPFTGLVTGTNASYWTSSTDAGDIARVRAWAIRLADGRVESASKGSTTLYVWPVRGGW